MNDKPEIRTITTRIGCWAHAMSWASGVRSDLDWKSFGDMIFDLHWSQHDKRFCLDESDDEVSLMYADDNMAACHLFLAHELGKDVEWDLEISYWIGG